MKRYVAGFAVSYDEGTVALVRKSHPSWQAGKLNGIGGHIEEGEAPIDAMRREFLEETAIAVSDWREFVLLGGKEWQVHFFVASVSTADLSALRGADDEPIEVHPIAAIPSLPVIPNLRWLVLLAIDKDRIVGELHETAGWVAP